jgi:hypothetical protein
MIIYLSRPAIAGREPNPVVGTMMRRYPRIKRAGCPSSVLSCTAWGFSCLANYSASGELLPRLFNLACASLPKNRRCLFCDTFRRRDFAIAAPAFFTRHVAVWCSDFPPASVAAYQRSSAIAINLTQSGTQESRNKHLLRVFLGFWFRYSFPNSKWRRHG